MEFWTAKELKKEFSVAASFYQMEIDNKTYLFRNHALIIRKGFAAQEHPDAVIVMANPGSCKPKDSSYNPPIIQNEVGILPYVEVSEDPTQLQLMRLMKLMNWNMVSICNLSDLCAGNMKDFAEKLSRIEKSYPNHTIFSDARSAERECLLHHPHTKIILSWGKDSKIEKLAKKALQTLSNNQTLFGQRYSSSWAFRHPHPMLKDSCIKWLEEMYLQLSEFEVQSEIAATEESNLKECRKGEFTDEP